MADKPLDVYGVKEWVGKHDFKKTPCVWDNLSEEDHNKPMGISCPCPKCTPFC